ncbi:MAG: hypothetical protein EBW14_18300, partial [Oxalobacteraceae bacterium]|nr:hypothetical protein [Oxalobacteraceae bacterium]
NGARCFARYVRDKGLSAKPVLRVQTQKAVIALRIAADGQASISIRLEDASEQPIRRQATVYLEAVSGVLSRLRVTTNDGVATVPVFANGLSPGDKVRVKAGWKYFPGVDDVTLEVI